MFSHVLVPLADDPDTAKAVFPAAAIARAFDAEVVLVAHPSAGVDPDELVDEAGTARMAAVRLGTHSLSHGLERLQPAFGQALVVATARLAEQLMGEWAGPLLVFGEGSDPGSYSVGGTILVDRAVRDAGDEALMRLGQAFGFEVEPVDDVATATGSSGQVIVPRRDRPGDVRALIERWAGPVFLLATRGS